MSPEEQLAASIAQALSPGFSGREGTALHLAETLLDATCAALPLAQGGEADEALAQLEQLATRADVYSWDGAPGWDVVLERGLGERAALTPGRALLDGLATARGGGDALGAGSGDGGPNRESQRAELVARARAEARRLIELGREVALLRSPEGARKTAATLPGASLLVALHAALLRLFGLAAAHALFALPEDLQAGALPPPAEDLLVAEQAAREAAGSDFATAQDEWLATLQAHNPAVAHDPAFRTFFAGLSHALRLSIALRRFRDEARAGRLARDPEALLGALGGFQPVRWSSMRKGVPAEWISALCPPAPQDEQPFARLAREASAALDLIGRLWTARGLTATAFAALATLLVARCASLLSLWEEL